MFKVDFLKFCHQICNGDKYKSERKFFWLTVSNCSWLWRIHIFCLLFLLLKANSCLLNDKVHHLDSVKLVLTRAISGSKWVYKINLKSSLGRLKTLKIKSFRIHLSSWHFLTVNLISVTQPVNYSRNGCLSVIIYVILHFPKIAFVVVSRLPDVDQIDIPKKPFSR